MAGQLTEAHKRMLEQPMSSLALPVRTINTLENTNGAVNGNGDVIQVVTVRDLLTLTPKDLLAMPNLGEKTLQSIFVALAKIGFCRGNKFTAVAAPPVQKRVAQQARAAKSLNFSSFSYEEE